MTRGPDGYWFTSSLFAIEPGEDKEINPGIYGRQLAQWLKEKLEQSGYAVEPVINEDWGRCLVCSREPFRLWVGCGSLSDEDDTEHGDGPPAKEDVTWHCFAEAEVPVLKKLFQKVDTGPAVLKLDADLGRILRSDARISLVDQP